MSLPVSNAAAGALYRSSGRPSIDAGRTSSSFGWNIDWTVSSATASWSFSALTVNTTSPSRNTRTSPTGNGPSSWNVSQRTWRPPTSTAVFSVPGWTANSARTTASSRSSPDTPSTRIAVKPSESPDAPAISTAVARSPEVSQQGVGEPAGITLGDVLDGRRALLQVLAVGREVRQELLELAVRRGRGDWDRRCRRWGRGGPGGDGLSPVRRRAGVGDAARRRECRRIRAGRERDEA